MSRRELKKRFWQPLGSFSHGDTQLSTVDAHDMSAGWAD
jgi:hypothetical protein